MKYLLRQNLFTEIIFSVYLTAQVTWIRHRDLHLLTVDKMTYTSDQRFVSVHNPQMGDWSLQVRYPQRRDSGVYECQVSTTPPVGYSMILSVVGKFRPHIVFNLDFVLIYIYYIFVNVRCNLLLYENRTDNNDSWITRFVHRHRIHS